MNVAAIRQNHLWDQIGCWASSACAVHCLVSPFIFLALPAFGKIWAHPASHALMALAVIPLALTVLLQGYRRHRKTWILAAASIGIALILTGSVLPYIGPEASAAAEAEMAADDGACASCCPSVVTDDAGSMTMKLPPAAIVTMLGSVCLIAAHLGNRWSCRGC